VVFRNCLVQVLFAVEVSAPVRLQLSTTKKNRVLLLAPSQFIIEDVSTTFGFVMAEDVTTTVEIASLDDEETSVSVSAPYHPCGCPLAKRDGV